MLHACSECLYLPTIIGRSAATAVYWSEGVRSDILASHCETADRFAHTHIALACMCEGVSLSALGDKMDSREDRARRMINASIFNIFKTRDRIA